LLIELENKIKYIYASLSALFLISGCVNFDKIHKYPPAWTPLESVSELKRFEGKYENKGAGNSMGFNMPTHELWYFLTRQRIRDTSNANVIITSSSPSTLDLILILGEKTIGRYTLTQGLDFEYKGDSIILTNASGFSRDAFGMGFGTAFFCIHLTSDGGLVGEIKGTAAGLLFYVIPAIGFGRNWNYWKKIN
jgi:hypothetical protein